MRFIIKESKQPKHGDERIVERFAIIPVYIGNEIRWLEKVKINQTYHGFMEVDGEPDEDSGWYDSEFIN